MTVAALLVGLSAGSRILGGGDGTAICNVNECSCSNEPSVLAQYRTLWECWVAPDSPSCCCADLDANGEVSLRDYAAFQVAPVHVCSRELLILQEGGLGFCPRPGSIYRAYLIAGLDGSDLLVGSLIAEGDPETDRCIPQGYPDCYVSVPFPPRVLTASERAELSAFIEKIPQEGCQPECLQPCVGECCFVFDPCVIWHVREHDDYCYGEGNAAEYRESLRAVVAYVAELATDGSP